ncbi:MAG TPA: hypothetical protein VHH36_07960, partial [Candidatus Thermoplasmatota archaeon]|nr:hypothetical protein [Candidatus Thermoplasmatota archaeon]
EASPLLRVALTVLALAWMPLSAAEDGGTPGLPGVGTAVAGAGDRGGDPDRECVGVYTNTVPMTTYVNPRCVPGAELVDQGSPALPPLVA